MRENRMLAWIAKWHQPDGWKSLMVYSIWEDGEVTLEKGGDLFGHRNLHKIEEPSVEPWPPTLFPVRNAGGTHGRIYLKGDYETALREMQEI